MLYRLFLIDMEKRMNELLKETELLDYSNSIIKGLIEKRDWLSLDEVDKVKAIYNYVRDEIKFGYSVGDSVPASNVILDGYGQCNTKSILFMALLRAVGIQSRLHGFIVHKRLQKGAVKGIAYRLSPKRILHSWVEVKVNDKWYATEGIILDKEYLRAIQKKFYVGSNTFCAYAVCTDRFSNPNIDWDLNDTYIQDKAILEDLGVYNTPDEFFVKYKQELSPFKDYLYRNIVRHILNKRIERLRNV